MTKRTDKFIYHPLDRNLYSIDYYGRSERFDTACKVADALVKEFEEAPEFNALLKKNKKLKAWVDSYQARKEYDSTIVERRKIEEAQRKKAEEERIRATEAALAKLSPEEIAACGIKVSKKKKGMVNEYRTI